MQDAFGRTVIHWICAKGYSGLLTEITNIEIEKKKDDGYKNEFSTIVGLGDDDEEEEKKANALNHRIIQNKHNVFDALNLQNKSGQTCLHWAVEKKEWYLVCHPCTKTEREYVDE